MILRAMSSVRFLRRFWCRRISSVNRLVVQGTIEHLKKIFASVVLALFIGYITEWTQLLHTESLVHPDWDKSVDADARVWSVAALIILYIALHNLTRRILRPIAIVLVIVWCVLMAICWYFSSIVPSIPVVANANHYIAIWRLVFIAADIAAVCAGATFGLWLAA